jgi:hypothetical protein
MGKPTRFLVDPENPQSIVQQQEEITKVVDGEVSFGNPQDPNDIDSTTLAGQAPAAGNHPGTLENIEGSWVEMSIDTLDQEYLFYHNLNVPVTIDSAVNQPNVRALHFWYEHDGTGAVAASTISYNYETGDAGNITENAMPLRFYAEATRTIDNTHPLKVSLFFIRAVR